MIIDAHAGTFNAQYITHIIDISAPIALTEENSSGGKLPIVRVILISRTTVAPKRPHGNALLWKS